MKIVLYKEKPISWNRIYSSPHWRFRQIIVQQIHQSVRDALLEMGIKKPQPFPYKVNIMITVYFKERMFDSSNIPAKIYEDALKGIVITDDTPQYVGTVATRSEKDAKNPRIEIEITEDTLDK